MNHNEPPKTQNHWKPIQYNATLTLPRHNRKVSSAIRVARDNGLVSQASIPHLQSDKRSGNERRRVMIASRASLSVDLPFETPPNILWLGQGGDGDDGGRGPLF
jgi:hypothetical protein